MFDAPNKPIRRAVRVSPALAASFDLAARIRGRTASEALREAMEAYAEVACEDDDRPVRGGAVAAGAEDRRDAEA